VVARLLKSGRVVRLRQGEFGSQPPFPVDDQTLVCAYFASADLGVFRVLGWPMPKRILDPFVEFRNLTNCLVHARATGLLSALVYYGLDTIGASEKDAMRAICIRGGPFTETELRDLVDYCQDDVEALARLLVAMAPTIDLPRALLRGRYMAAVSAMEHEGVPVDVDVLALLLARWDAVRDDLIREVDVGGGYHVFEGHSINRAKFEQYLIRAGIPWWQYTETGLLSLSDATLKESARAHPSIAPLRELQHALGEMKLNDLAVGSDHRNRTLLSPFGSRSGRNTPSSNKFIFGPSVWLRSLVKPPPGYGVAYIDWSQQEFGIAAALSNDPAMLAAYESGDPYLAFAKQARGVPADATKETHGPQRELFKSCVLGVAYGMSQFGLSAKIDRPLPYARALLRAHRETYRTFWRWSDDNVDHALLRLWLTTVFGWFYHVGEDVNLRSLRNFPMQANGAEMLRLACCHATEAGVGLAAPVHDAVLIVAPLDRLDADVETIRVCMAKASRQVLAGFELRTDAHIVRYPDRYMDPRGAVMWKRVCGLIGASGELRGPRRE
jgi:DNA polymerase-1